MTVEEGREYINSHALEGTSCPCCGQFVKIYKRKITGSMAKALSIMAELRTESYVSIANLFNKKDHAQDMLADLPKLRHWDLIERDPKLEGFWRITREGRAFVRGEIRVPKYIYLLFGQLIDMSRNDTVKIEDCFKSNFDKEEIMQ